jgi:hypothetical protein
VSNVIRHPPPQLPEGEESAVASRNLVNAFEDHQRAAAVHTRLQMVGTFVHDAAARAAAAAARDERAAFKAARAAADGGAGLQPAPLPPPHLHHHQLTPSEAFAAAPPRLREELEVMYTDEAETVFTTLSSSGRGVFSKLQRGFPLVSFSGAPV